MGEQKSGTTSGKPAPSKPGRPWWEDAWLRLMGAPTSRSQLVSLLRSAEQRDLLDSRALSIMEGALLVSDIPAKEIMVPRAQVVFLRHNQNPQDMLDTVIQSGHSRFPVIGEEPNFVHGILLAKDLLSFAKDDHKLDFVLRDLLRPSTAIPESKRLNVLLQEFKTNKNHLAVVYDEYGAVSGIVTIEDVLEQIVGDIEDEFDLNDENYINRHLDGSFTVKAIMPIDDFNEYFKTSFDDDPFDTIGGMVTQCFGHLPQRSEEVSIDGYEFKVLNADGRRVHLLQLTCPDQELT